VRYYEKERASLAAEFLEELSAAVNRVRENPQAYADEDGGRRAPLHRFPYSVVYIDFEDHIWIAAVAHHHRKPYWARRKP
jgi:toxin ParE1/3/4